ncbi:MAG TPA: amidohydrolase family protein [Ignavibacteriaceae bacterium]|nr:amidohydrolase family protein [Ignavibacteriaceae bacterium]
MKKNKFEVFLLLFIFFNSSIIVNGQSGKKGNEYAITNVSIVDVENGSILKNKNITIKDGLIYKITSGTDEKELPGFNIIDGTNLYLIPGLFDSHVHYFDPETFGPLLISYGVLFVREMGNVTEAAVKNRSLLNSGKILGPEMITTGSCLDGNPPFIPPISIVCNTPEEGRAMVKKQIEDGVDQIKTFSNLKQDVFYAIVDECKKNNVKAVGHVPEVVFIEDAAEAGLSSSEHLFGFGNVLAKELNEPLNLKGGGMGADQEYFIRYPEVSKEKLQLELKKISSTGMAVCPTLIVMKCGKNLNEIFNRNYPMLDYISPMVWNMWKQMWEPQKGSVPFIKQIYPNYISFLKDLYNAKFTLLVGTDLLFAGVIPGFSVHEEMEIWQEAGIPAIDILRSATITPARFIGVDKSLGSIEEGKKASFVILQDNPLVDIKNTQKIEAVFFHGDYFSRQQLDSIRWKIKEANKDKYNGFINKQ